MQKEGEDAKLQTFFYSAIFGSVGCREGLCLGVVSMRWCGHCLLILVTKDQKGIIGTHDDESLVWLDIASGRILRQDKLEKSSMEYRRNKTLKKRLFHAVPSVIAGPGVLVQLHHDQRVQLIRERK
jgi:hypothetical protein